MICKKEAFMRTLNIFLVFGMISLFSWGCAQRVSLHASHGEASKKIFFQQGSAAPIQLAPITAEDAKRISESRAQRSGVKGKSRRSQPFGLGGSSNGSSSILE